MKLNNEQSPQGKPAISACVLVVVFSYQVHPFKTGQQNVADSMHRKKIRWEGKL